MGTISDKLTYLNTTKGKIKDSINLTGANIGNSDTFRSYSAKLRDGLVDVINDGGKALYNNFPKATGTGSSVTLNNTYQAPMKIALSGNTYQGENPTPSSPQDIEVVTGYNEVEVVGKNLIDDSLMRNGYNISSNGGLTTDSSYINKRFASEQYIKVYNGMVLSSNYYMINCGKYDKNKNFIERPQFTHTQTINITHDGYIRLTFQVNNISSLEGKLILCEGSTIPTNYEPYQSQTYELNLGKNLFDKDNVTWIRNNNDNYTSTENTNTTRIRTQNLLKLEGGKTYTISGIPSGISVNAIKFYANTSSTSAYSYVTTATFSVPTEASYVIFQFGGADFTDATNTLMANANIQIELGSQATPYSPYFTPIELCKIGDYKDEIRRSTGKNLFDKDNANTINCNMSQTVVGVSANAKCLYISCEANKTYTISKSQISSRFKAGTTATTPADTVPVIDYVSNDGGTSITITTSANAKYLCVYYYLNGTDTLTEQEILDSIQIEEGSTKTDLEPYGVGVWYKYGRFGKVVLDGSETCTITTPEHNGFVRYSLSFNRITPLTEPRENNAKCTHFKPAATDSSSVENLIDFRTNRLFLINTNVATTIEDFKSWLSANNVTFYYPINPTITTLDTELQNQLEDIYNNAKSYLGQTNITAEYVSGNQPFIMDVSALLKEE